MNLDSLAATLLRAFGIIILAVCILFGIYLIIVTTPDSNPIVNKYSAAFGLLTILCGMFSFAVLTAFASITENLIAIRESNEELLAEEDEE